MKKLLFITTIALLAWCNSARAQFLKDVQSHPINEISYTEVEGDPFLVNKWLDGTVTLPNNKKFEAALKLDTYGSHLLFEGKNGEAMELENKPLSFSLTAGNDVSDIQPMVFVNNFPSADHQNGDSWYQLIADGKVKLLKYYGKQTMETKAFNSATTTKSFTSFQVYYVFKNGGLIKTGNTKKTILKSLDDHAAQVDAYLKDNKLNFKSDADLQKLFVWYNSLN